MAKVKSSSLLEREQRDAMLLMLNKKVCCFTGDCGFGKTVCGLSAFHASKLRNADAKMLVVSTPKGVKETWGTEHKDWEHIKGLKVVTLTGTPAQRLRKFETQGDIYVVSYHSLGWLHSVNKGDLFVNFTFVFADEGDCLKGATSVFRKNLIKCAPDPEFKIIATATPKTREEDDYWGLVKYLDDGKCLKSRTIEDFRSKYMKNYTLPHTQAVLWKMDARKVPKLERKIAHLFFTYDLPKDSKIPIKVVTHEVKLRKKARKIYEALRDEQCLNSVVFKTVTIDGEEFEVKDHDKSLDASVLSTKLAQLSNGFLYVDENVRISPKLLKKTTNVKGLLKNLKRRIAVDLFDDRIKAFKQLLKLIRKKHGKKQPIVIPYFYQHELVQLKRLLPNATEDTEDDIVGRWTRGEISELLTQYNRSSKSLNLQYGGYIMAMYSPTFLWVDDYQIVRRLARKGQIAKRVWCYRLYIKGTIDDVKARRLDQRSVGHARFQEKIVRKLRH